ncbi:putative septin [Wickerhamomyces ciferrii]|uniref:Septin n=1 Tax=Wickerhamomyces ciferrii (strain ATCC 14091 / BCRC 22168 / CBS 111 / JCM 3599 / NBRC 0793 / NRRL Y-1031 F-60-10) TaxID=1206466 RepID=K0L112_WICCF|nr:putative septin [Wickerhamomyces ciferrii]CCH47148.1 putative septin [Wickerhamomyces ciferrii]
MSQSALRYKNDAKRGIKYTLMITGASGTGKTTFINSLLDTNLLPHRYQPIGSSIDEPTLLSYIGDFNYHSREFNPLKEYNESTIAITSSKIEILDDDGSKILLNVIDTPGFGDNTDNEVCYTEIVSYLEQQFDHVLAEETRIRRDPKFEDTRVHICLYFLEPTGHGLREIDVECIKKMSKFVNVLPVISKSDSFTQTELQGFKKNILYDIKKFNVPIFEFNYDEDEDDLETIEENKLLRSLQPFAIMGSKEKYEIDGQLKFARKYPWGIIDIEESSDFIKLKNVLFGSHLQDFKDLTTNFLYENYRSEKLSSVTEKEEEKFNGDVSTAFDVNNPSLSNLAALTLDDKHKDIDLDNNSDKESIRTPSMKSTGSFSNGPRPDVKTSPYKEVRDSIKNENESIISSIKNSPRMPYSPEPSRNQLRTISETVPYVLKHERIISRQAKLQELEERSARELAIRAAALEKKAAELKRRERMLKGGGFGINIKKESTSTDLSSIINQSP